MELIRITEGTLGFGDYTLLEKEKLSDVPYQGDLYKVKTFEGITKLEKNGAFLYESVPGTCVENFREESEKLSFSVEGTANTQITIGVEEEKEYRVSVEGKELGTMTTNLSGKLVISLELEKGKPQKVLVERI